MKVIELATVATVFAQVGVTAFGGFKETLEAIEKAIVAIGNKMTFGQAGNLVKEVHKLAEEQRRERELDAKRDENNARRDLDEWERELNAIAFGIGPALPGVRPVNPNGPILGRP